MQLAVRNEVVLQWVPRHEGIDGNEKADDLAKKGTEMCLVEPDPCRGVSYSCSKGLGRSWLAWFRGRFWWTTLGLRQSKLGKPICNEKWDSTTLSRRGAES